MSRPVINLNLGDCMEAMSKMPDNAYDLAIVDPPYGIGASNPSKKPEKVRQKNGSLLYVKQYKSRKLNWDNSVPSVEFFNELKRVSKNQII